MWVVDQSGNADYCLVLVTVIAPVEGCRGELGKVKGTVSSIQGAGIDKVFILLKNSDETRQVLTNNHGRYDFESYAMDGSSYQLWPEKYDNPLDGINTSDVIRISKHLLLKEPLKNGFQLEAADVNDDGAVSVLDIITLRKLLLGKIDSLPIQNPWQFFNVNKQSQSLLSLGIDYKPLLNFTGVKIGDVNGDITNYSDVGRGLQDVVMVYYTDQRFLAGQDLEVSIFSTEALDMEGLQMELSLDKGRLQLVSVVGERIGLEEGEWSNLDNRLLISWINREEGPVKNGEMFTVRLKTLGDGQLSDAIALTSLRLNSELYNKDRTIPLKLLPKLSETSMFVGQNVPNPFRHSTAFQLQIPEAMSVNITISDLTGHVFVHRSERYLKGLHKMEVSRDQLGAPGLYLLQVSTGGHQTTKKMILLE
ncbi:MAG: T9SS type A sorting domain-containing protein [Saprospiraceae bacterium]|nr:T9SS type A sorting domain-containing protein [Saprospiraceae bacterium]